MSRVTKILNERYQARMPRLSARVTSRPTDRNGRSLGYVVATIAGQTGVRVTVGVDDVYYPGDNVLVEQRGTASAASYTALGWQSGTRPDSGDLEFTEETTIGNNTYAPGDRAWGNPFGAHFHLDYNNGKLFLKVGSSVTGVIDAARGLYVAGNPDSVHGEFGPNGIEFKSGETVLSGWDAVGRSIYGIETLGRPHGPGIQQREVIDPDTGETYYVWQVLGLNGVPGIMFRTGTETSPDDYRLTIGPPGATQSLTYANGALALTGTITAAAGTIGGWTIGSDQITGTGSGRSAYLKSYGALQLYGGSSGKWVLLDAGHATYPMAVGSATASSAPFRVDWNGNVYITGLKALSGSNSVTGFVIDIEQTSSGATDGAIKGAGEIYGIYGYANKYGVYGYAIGATGAAGVYGTGGTSYTGVWGSGDPGVYAEAYDASSCSLRLSTGPMDAGGLNIENVKRLYLGGTTCYLYLSGTDVYWYNGSTSTKLN